MKICLSDRGDVEVDEDEILVVGDKRSYIRKGVVSHDGQTRSVKDIYEEREMGYFWWVDRVFGEWIDE